MAKLDKLGLALQAMEQARTYQELGEFEKLVRELALAVSLIGDVMFDYQGHIIYGEPKALRNG